MNATVLLFRDPTAPLEGANRDAVLARYRDACAIVAEEALGSAFDRACVLASAEKLSVDDAASVFARAVIASLELRGLA